jgi:hypothetical protein
MKSTRLVILGAGAAFVSLLIALAGNAATGQEHWPGVLEVIRAHAWLSFFLLAPITIGLAALTIFWSDASDLDIGEDLSKVCADLAAAVSAQWQLETNLRDLNDPYPIRIEWQAANSDLTPDWQSLERLAKEGSGWPTPDRSKWALSAYGLAGADAEIVDVLGRVPTGRLVVLGEPGSGKSILLIRLVLGLLARQVPGDPIPVLLSLASWNPEELGLRTWIASRLIIDYAELGRPIRRGRKESKAIALLNAGRIMPVLDGLDEIPTAHLGQTIGRINHDLSPGMKIVLASRSAEYRLAVHPPEGIEVQLAGGAAIEINPVDTSEILTYLKNSAGGSKRWEPVREAIDANRELPIAKALTTPLMAFLARAIYNPRPGETFMPSVPPPTELLDKRRFPDQEALRQHLYDSFVPAAYRPWRDRPSRPRWSSSDAQRWLGFLAADLQSRQNGVSDLAWWRLRGAAPRWLSGTFVGLTAGLAGFLGFAVPLGLGAGLAVAALTAVSVRRWVPADRRGLTMGLAGGLVGGVTGALIGFAIFGGARLGAYLVGGLAYAVAVSPMGGFPGGVIGGVAGALASRAIETLDDIHTVTISSHFINGLGLGLALGLGAGLASKQTPARRLRRSRLGTLCGICMGLVAGVDVWRAAGLKTALIVGAVTTVAAGYAGGVFFEPASTDVTSAASPQEVLRRDRITFTVSLLAFGLAMGIGTGLATGFGINIATGRSNGVVTGIMIGLANLIASGVAVAFVQASWGPYYLSRCWLALRGNIPWDLMGFLADAHANRNVLRQVGTVYQFRHYELQRRLAAQAATPARREFAFRLVGDGYGAPRRRRWLSRVPVEAVVPEIPSLNPAPAAPPLKDDETGYIGEPLADFTSLSFKTLYRYL